MSKCLGLMFELSRVEHCSNISRALSSRTSDVYLTPPNSNSIHSHDFLEALAATMQFQWSPKQGMQSHHDREVRSADLVSAGWSCLIHPQCPKSWSFQVGCVMSAEHVSLLPKMR
eukprot:CAMPEP_0198135482 /NCGR_PEP_ID=MMETSP1442-20131203/60614_1 /TAXON_ID= /ORGANISM="Craspedostauros australis, Strain CCMP3328" /LENGTH=114 /DNA_ID=CAMNT_0043796655 /DNA_START=649 /DNA_END=990 /DNA_ORIENTATION=-